MLFPHAVCDSFGIAGGRMTRYDLIELVSFTGISILDVFLRWFLTGAGIVFGAAFAARLIGVW